MRVSRIEQIELLYLRRHINVNVRHYSQCPIIRTLKGGKSLFELSNVRVIESFLVHKLSNRCPGNGVEGPEDLFEISNVRVIGH